ncbi:MAG: SAM-dependent methyltransferase [Streptosporangiales bacterium]|nr:SAM-dependent methyltransferase [Streptosporangiales bacterium]
MTDSSPHPSSPEPPSGVDTTVPHSPRIWNYWLGGKDNYAVDREAGDRYVEVFPGIVDVARESRGFLTRVVRYLAADAGIRQFLDIGTGLPTADNTHQIAQQVAPESRIVYADNDPLVLAHARALLTSTPEGVTDYIHADLREGEAILDAAGRTLDLTRPVALMLMGVMGHIPDDEAYGVVQRLLDALPSGSYLALCDGTNTSDAITEAQRGYDETGAVPYRLRGLEQIARFFEGLELVEPGLVSCSRWRPEPGPHGRLPDEVDAYGAVGQKRR